MNTEELIYQKAQKIPESEAREVLDFMEFLEARRTKRAMRPFTSEHDEKAVSPDEHTAWVEQMRAITAAQPMTHTTVQDMRREPRY